MEQESLKHTIIKWTICFTLGFIISMGLMGLSLYIVDRFMKALFGVY